MSGLEPFFLGLQDELRAALGTGALIPHPGAKGDASELNWAGMLERHLPQRYRVVTKCFVLDHRGDLSHEIDIVLADRQYSPIVFQSGARQVIPAEAVYAVFEVKPQTDRANVLYSAGKARSVRALDRTNAPVPTRGGGIADPEEPGPILGGLLTTRCAWKSGLGAPFMKAIREQPAEGAGRTRSGPIQRIAVARCVTSSTPRGSRRRGPRRRVIGAIARSGVGGPDLDHGQPPSIAGCATGELAIGPTRWQYRVGRPRLNRCRPDVGCIVKPSGCKTSSTVPLASSGPSKGSHRRRRNVHDVLIVRNRGS